MVEVVVEDFASVFRVLKYKKVFLEKNDLTWLSAVKNVRKWGNEAFWSGRWQTSPESGKKLQIVFKSIMQTDQSVSK